MSLNGKKGHSASFMTLGELFSTIFMLCVTELCLMEKLLLYLRACTILSIMSLNGKKSAPNIINDIGGAKKNPVDKKISSMDFLGPIRLDTPNGGIANL